MHQDVDATRIPTIEDMMFQVARTIVVTTLLVAGCLPVGAAGSELPESAKRLRSAMEATIGVYRDQMLMEKMAAFVQYSNGLASAAETCRLAADLDGVLVVGRELKSISKAVAIPEQDEPGTHQAVRQARNAYRAAVANAQESFERRRRALLIRHVADLDTLKKRLTVESKIEDAVAVRDAIEQYKKLLGQDDASKRSPPGEELVPCPVCSGTGTRAGPCPKCSGSGLCAMCSGEGVRKPMMMGRADRMPCITCKQSGKCAQCGGTGQVSTAACNSCKGTGKVP